ncbi:proton-coupled amino acid transporter-like protein acs [Anticarsia gemmatalis]|uniref:proton-coupled amino acid transporter-like protein acs n=1 Tax=Anticarsia gemmatalis TaxID=129554 RepID=UPI003F766D55
MTAAAKDRNFKNHTTSQADEDSYNYVQFREGIHPTSLFGSIAHLIKGALGGGVLSGHVAYMKAGIGYAIPMNFGFGCYMGYCLYLLVWAVQVLCKRTRQPFLSYADAGEAAMMLFPKKGAAKYARFFRYAIDTIICMDLFGACATYQIIVSKSLKQLVENTHATSMYGPPGYPSLRMYLAMMIPVMVIICLIRHLKYLAPFSIVANIVVALCIVMAGYYCSLYNPNLEDLKITGGVEGVFQFVGMQVFSMSCAGVVIPIEANMKHPNKFPIALICGMMFIMGCTFAVSLCGYAAFKDESAAPITINFPMTTVPKIFKGAICVMIIITHALNFWVPFNLCWYYIHKKCPQDKLVRWERIFRAIFVITIGVLAICFPNITGIMGFLGCFCLSNMAFIWPNVIFLLVSYERPGYGFLKWRLLRSFVLMAVGFFILCCGTVVSVKDLVESEGG